MSWPAPAAAGSVDAAALVFGSSGPAKLTARGSNGYAIEVAGSGRRVTLTATGPAGTAIYTVPGRVTRSGIAANFGKLGKVDVEFRPSRRMRIETPPNRCKGKPRVTRWGVFLGMIRFAGERGYTRLRAGSAPGRTNFTPRWKCKRRRGPGKPVAGGQPGVPGETSEDALILEISNRRTGLEAGAYTFRPPGEGGLTLFVAGIEERRKRMQVTRFAFVPARNRAFSFDDSLVMATIAPPAPFSGSATFQREPGGSPSWTGSLSVVLPGTARIPLVGADYRTRLYRLGEDGIAKPGT